MICLAKIDITKRPTTVILDLPMPICRNMKDTPKNMMTKSIMKLHEN